MLFLFFLAASQAYTFLVGTGLGAVSSGEAVERVPLFFFDPLPYLILLLCIECLLPEYTLTGRLNSAAVRALTETPVPHLTCSHRRAASADSLPLSSLAALS